MTDLPTSKNNKIISTLCIRPEKFIRDALSTYQHFRNISKLLLQILHRKNDHLRQLPNYSRRCCLIQIARSRLLVLTLPHGHFISRGHTPFMNEMLSFVLHQISLVTEKGTSSMFWWCLRVFQYPPKLKSTYTTRQLEIQRYLRKVLTWSCQKQMFSPTPVRTLIFFIACRTSMFDDAHLHHMFTCHCEARPLPQIYLALHWRASWSLEESNESTSG